MVRERERGWKDRQNGVGREGDSERKIERESER